MEPQELKNLSKDIDLAYKSLGQASLNKKSEIQNLIFRRSIYIVKDLKKGSILDKNSIRRIRPGYGLAPKYYDEILGKKNQQEC